jgi:hypothetical protein
MPLAGYEGVVTGYTVVDGQIHYYFDTGEIVISSADYVEAGYQLREMSRCGVTLVRGGYAKVFNCGIAKGKERERVGLGFSKK